MQANNGLLITRGDENMTDKLEEIVERLKYRKYLTVEEEEEYMESVYDTVIGDIENYSFLTPNWIRKQE